MESLFVVGLFIFLVFVLLSKETDAEYVDRRKAENLRIQEEWWN